MRYSVIEQKVNKLYKRAFLKKADEDTNELIIQLFSELKSQINLGIKLSEDNEDLVILNKFFKRKLLSNIQLAESQWSGESDEDEDPIDNIIEEISEIRSPDSEELQELKDLEDKELQQNILKTINACLKLSKKIDNIASYDTNLQSNTEKATSTYDHATVGDNPLTKTFGPDPKVLAERLFRLNNPDSPESRNFLLSMRAAKKKYRDAFNSLSEERKDQFHKDTKSSQDKSVQIGKERLQELLSIKSEPSSRKEEIQRIIDIDQAESQAKKLSSKVKDPNEFLNLRKLRTALALLGSDEVTPEIEEYFKAYNEAKANRKQYEKGFGAKIWEGSVIGEFANVQNTFSGFLNPSKVGFVDWSFDYLLMPTEIYGSYLRQIAKLKEEHSILVLSFKQALKEAGITKAKGTAADSLIPNVSNDILLEERLEENKKAALKKIEELKTKLKGNCSQLIMLEESKVAIIKNIMETKPIELMSKTYSLIQKRYIIGEGIELAKQGVFGDQRSQDKLIKGDNSESAKALGEVYIGKLTAFIQALNQEPLNKSIPMKTIISKLENILGQLIQGLNS